MPGWLLRRVGCGRLTRQFGECVFAGGEAIAVQVDVSNPASMESLARRAVESYGRVDIWVNNAAVSLYARVDEGPLEVHRRVIETNLLGYLYGARIAVHISANKAVACFSMCPPLQPMSGSPMRVLMSLASSAPQTVGSCIRQEVSEFLRRSISVRCFPVRLIHRSFSMPGTTSAVSFNHSSRSHMRGRSPM